MVMPPISVLLKPASGNCNMTCDYCFYCDEQKKRTQASYGMMNEETLKNVMRKMILHAEGSCSVAFQGGEPSLCGLNFFRKAVEYAKKYNRKNIHVAFAFQTNGTNITEEWCEFFAENHFLVGISLDGNRENHNRYRHYKSGETTFDRIMETCRMLEKYRVEYNILTVVHKQTAQEIQNIYGFFKKKNFDFQQYIPCLDSLFEEPGRMEYSLTPKKYGEFLIKLFECWYQDFKRGHMPYIRQFDNYVGMIKGYLPEACDQRGCCGIQYVLEADGSVYPCDFYVLDGYRLGNVNENSIEELDSMRQKIGFLQESVKISQECLNCEYLSLCRSGCRRSRIKVKDEMYQNYWCEGYRMFFDACLPRMKEIAEFNAD